MADLEVTLPEPTFSNNMAQILSLGDDIPPGETLMSGRSSLGDENRQEAIDIADDSGSDADIELSPDGILDEITIEKGLSQLGSSADGTQQVFLHLTLPGYNLTDIGLLTDYTQLQKVEIPYNRITNLSALGCMPFLIELDASHNEIHTLLGFEPPLSLKEVDLSYNNITEMTDLSAHHSLTKLVLDNNQIEEMRGMEGCHRLAHLSLVHNCVRRMGNLKDLPIKYLNLRGNRVEVIEDLESLKYLREINLAGNCITSLKGLQGHDLLEIIDLESNQIAEIQEIRYLCDLKLLRDLNMLRNPIQEIPEYRLSVLFQLQNLTELDRKKVEVEEKVNAVNMFNPPAKVVAARDHMKLLVCSFLQPARIYDSTLPNTETPYPMLVLVGPAGSGKLELARKLVQEFPDYFGYAVCHTTRGPQSGEIEGKDYYFVSKQIFDEMISYGKFVATYELMGNSYGLTLDAIEGVAKEGLASVIQLEIEGVMSLKCTYFEPRYVLVMPSSEKEQEDRLNRRGCYTPKQVAEILGRSSFYWQVNQSEPGFFDMSINSDDIVDGYKHLKKLVMDYLAISGGGDGGQSLAGIMAAAAADKVNAGDSREPSSPFAGSTGSGFGGSVASSGIKTWSRNTPGGGPTTSSHTGSQGHGVKNRSSSGPRKSAVEQASYERRVSAAKAAASGIVPKPLEQLAANPPGTAPANGTDNDHPGSSARQRPLSMPTEGGGGTVGMDYDSPDSSEDEDKASSPLSNLSEERGFSPAGSLTPAGSATSVEGANRPRSQSSEAAGIVTPRLGSAGSTGPRPGSRLGSDQKPVLPPIGSTDKYEPEY